MAVATVQIQFIQYQTSQSIKITKFIDNSIMDSTASSIIDILLQVEGGYNAGLDGGTYCGLTWKWCNDWSGWSTVKSSNLKNGETLSSLTDSVKNYYYDNHYTRLKCGSISCVMISGQLLCYGVHHGENNAVKDLQTAINEVAGENAVKVDGSIGNGTLAYLNNEAYMTKIASKFVARIKAYYDTCTEYKDGFLNRLSTVTSGLTTLQSTL